ncbi:MAG: hypothetical protein NE327_01345 [Lentisphaeraceae bacterium]|nr:hypothetical protein [Lentisphaeraceae bacterium]
MKYIFILLIGLGAYYFYQENSKATEHSKKALKKDTENTVKEKSPTYSSLENKKIKQIYIEAKEITNSYTEKLSLLKSVKGDESPKVYYRHFSVKNINAFLSTDKKIIELLSITHMQRLNDLSHFLFKVKNLVSSLTYNKSDYLTDKINHKNTYLLKDLLGDITSYINSIKEYQHHLNTSLGIVKPINTLVLQDLQNINKVIDDEIKYLNYIYKKVELFILNDKNLYEFLSKHSKNFKFFAESNDTKEKLLVLNKTALGSFKDFKVYFNKYLKTIKSN